MSPIHTDSLAAWTDLQERGGLELHGRDEGFEAELKNRLAPSAGSLEEALRSATTDDLVRAFFDALQPFVAMFRAILEFFEKAGAVEGREHWNIIVDDVDVRLDHFRRFLKEWNSVPCDIEVPAVDFHGAWAIVHATQKMPELEPVYAGINSYWSDVADIDDWLRGYRSSDGRYEEWPHSLAPSSLGSGYSDVAALGLAGVHTIQKAYGSREELIAKRRRHYAIDRADGLSLRTIAQNETDYWLGTLVALLAHAQTLPSAAKRELSERLRDQLARYPRRKFGAQIKMAD